MSDPYEKYRSETGRLHPDYSRSARLLARLLRGALPQNRSISILDVGAGAGELLAALKQWGYQDCVGIDISDEQVAVGRAAGIDHLEQGDAFEWLSQHTQAYDVITMVDVIEHFTFADATRLCRLSAAALKPGGVLLLRTPNALLPAFTFSDATHEQHLTCISLRQLIAHAGMHVECIRECSPEIVGMLSACRRLAWCAVRQVIRFVYVTATGSDCGGVFTPNMLAIARATESPNEG